MKKILSLLFSFSLFASDSTGENSLFERSLADAVGKYDEDAVNSLLRENSDLKLNEKNFQSLLELETRTRLVRSSIKLSSIICKIANKPDPITGEIDRLEGLCGLKSFPADQRQQELGNKRVSDFKCALNDVEELRRLYNGRTLLDKKEQFSRIMQLVKAHQAKFQVQETSAAGTSSAATSTIHIAADSAIIPSENHIPKRVTLQENRAMTYDALKISEQILKERLVKLQQPGASEPSSEYNIPATLREIAIAITMQEHFKPSNNTLNIRLFATPGKDSLFERTLHEAVAKSDESTVANMLRENPDRKLNETNFKRVLILYEEYQDLVAMNKARTAFGGPNVSEIARLEIDKLENLCGLKSLPADQRQRELENKRISDFECPLSDVQQLKQMYNARDLLSKQESFFRIVELLKAHQAKFQVQETSAAGTSNAATSTNS